MTTGEMKRKIDKIGEEFEIRIVWIKNGDNCASRQQRTVWVKHIANSGDLVVALHEIGHIHCDARNDSANPHEKLDAETNAWKWALERYNSNFDEQGWKRLHESLRQYYWSVNDTRHPAYKLLMEAEKKCLSIRPRVSSFATNIHLPKQK